MDNFENRKKSTALVIIIAVSICFSLILIYALSTGYFEKRAVHKAFYNFSARAGDAEQIRKIDVYEGEQHIYEITDFAVVSKPLFHDYVIDVTVGSIIERGSVRAIIYFTDNTEATVFYGGESSLPQGDDYSDSYMLAEYSDFYFTISCEPLARTLGELLK